jgi:hypothetical protein
MRVGRWETGDGKAEGRRVMSETGLPSKVMALWLKWSSLGREWASRKYSAIDSAPASAKQNKKFTKSAREQLRHTNKIFVKVENLDVDLGLVFDQKLH